MKKTKNYRYKPITLSEFDHLIKKTVVTKYKIVDDYNLELIFDRINIFQKPNTIFLSGHDGTFFCIRNILLVEESDSIFRIHMNKSGDDYVITIILINTN